MAQRTQRLHREADMNQAAPPTLGNQYDDDRVLRSYLARVLPGDVLREVEESLREMGRLAGAELYEPS